LKALLVFNDLQADFMDALDDDTRSSIMLSKSVCLFHLGNFEASEQLAQESMILAPTNAKVSEMTILYFHRGLTVI
jgi:hypothetical protein